MSGMVYKNFSFSTPFLRGYRELKIPILDSSGQPAWPEMFPHERIAVLRDTVGARHFSAQMMLEFIAPDRACLDPDGLHVYSDEFDARTAKLGCSQITGCAVYWDPSGGRKNADGSVCVLIYRDDSAHHIFIHDVAYLTVPDDTLHPLAYQCDKVLNFCIHHNIYRIAIETNGIGNALPEIMYDTALRRSIKIYVQRIINTKNKENRILDSIEPLLSTGHLHAHSRIQQTPLIAEMIGWTPQANTTHDDGLDAVAGAINCTPVTVRPQGSVSQIFNANTDFKL